MITNRNELLSNPVPFPIFSMTILVDLFPN
jgi:hypothetical protein